MKGTAVRGETPAEDAALADALAGDPKQRAENLMIVDLMRNDLSRVALAGSVAVPELFRVERYPTVHQMTSTVTATLAEGADAVDVLTALFPCGSITGAPKQRSMEVIAAVEPEARGIYTGAIGGSIRRAMRRSMWRSVRWRCRRGPRWRRWGWDRAWSPTAGWTRNMRSASPRARS